MNIGRRFKTEALKKKIGLIIDMTQAARKVGAVAQRVHQGCICHSRHNGVSIWIFMSENENLILHFESFLF